MGLYKGSMLWVLVNSIGKVTCNKRFKVQTLFTPKTNWCWPNDKDKTSRSKYYGLKFYSISKKTKIIEEKPVKITLLPASNTFKCPGCLVHIQA